MNRSDLSPIEKKVDRHLKEYFPDPGNTAFVLGVSGGVDSMTLLYLFKRFGLDLSVVHVNYQKRGRASDKDAEFVKETAAEWGYDCRQIKLDPEEAGDRNFQQWAREARYGIFRKMADEMSADGIAVAHHEDDQVETILQKLFRGAGLESWRGMKIWDGELFRPLLDSSREEIERYAERNSIPFRVDVSNLQTGFARNFLRNEWLEDLEQHFPGWKDNVLKLSGQAELFSITLDHMSSQMKDDRDRIDRQQFLALEPRLRRTVMLHMLKSIDPGITVSGDALKQVDDIDEIQTGGELQLNREYSILRDRDWLKIVFEHKESLGSITLSREAVADHGFTYNDLLFTIEQYREPDFEAALYLDADNVQWPLELRPWRHGDSFRPFGMKGHQNVSDHLTNRKIGAAVKKKAMVIETFEETICAVIFPPIEHRLPPGTISEDVRCDDHTSECLTIAWKE